MTSNLPPGCTRGNEDPAFEKFAEELDELFNSFGVQCDSDGLTEALWQKLQNAYNAGHSDGYALARADAMYGDGGW